jgi:hypothetical protein
MCNVKAVGLSRSNFIVILGCGLLAGMFCCSCATPYRPLEHHTGYVESQVSTNEYEVSFLANGESSYDRAFDFALLRAAEIALSRHANSLTVTDVVNLSSARKYQIPPHYYWTASPYLDRGGETVPSAPEFLAPTQYSYLMMTQPAEGIFYRPGVKLRIKLSDEVATGYYPYDPAKLRERLKQKYGLRE